MGLNKVFVLGFVGADPEVKHLPGGAMVTKLRVATSERWTDKSGKAQERTEWHSVVVFGNQAQTVSKYVFKGSKVMVEGSLRTRSWEHEGEKKYKTEVIASHVQFLDDKKKESKQQEFEVDQGFAPGQDDDLPF